MAGEAQSLSAELTNNLVSSAQRTELLSLVTEAGERALLAGTYNRTRAAVAVALAVTLAVAVGVTVAEGLGVTDAEPVSGAASAME